MRARRRRSKRKKKTIVVVAVGRLIRAVPRLRPASNGRARVTYRLYIFYCVYLYIICFINLEIIIIIRIVEGSVSLHS